MQKVLVFNSKLQIELLSYGLKELDRVRVQMVVISPKIYPMDVTKVLLEMLVDLPYGNDTKLVLDIQ